MKSLENKTTTKKIALNGIFIALIIALQLLNLPNLITGVLVNAILVFITLYSGKRSGIVISLLSPFGGMISGHVAPYMYPVLPIIGIGNVLLVICIDYFQLKPLWFKLIIPSFIKAAFIGLVGFIAVNYLVSEPIVGFVVWGVLGIQFFTAIPGILLGMKLSESIKKQSKKLLFVVYNLLY